MHGSDTSQDAGQLILPDVRQPLCDGVLNHFVDPEETGTCRKSQKVKLLTANLGQITEK